MKISIITATLNSARTVRDTITSISNQKYSDIEHLIIDGQSSDETINIVKKNSSKRTRIYVEKDEGLYHAMNKGIDLAKGDIIGILNSDDFYANKNVLKIVKNIFENNPSIDACYADLVYTDQFNTFKNIRYWKSSKFIPGSFSKGWCPPHTTFFARRSVYKIFGNFNLDYSLASDNEIMMRFLEVHKIKSLHIPEVWVKMRSGGTTNKNLKNIFLQNLEILSALRKNGLSSNPLRFFFYKIILRLSQRLIRINNE